MGVRVGSVIGPVGVRGESVRVQGVGVLDVGGLCGQQSRSLLKWDEGSLREVANWANLYLSDERSVGSAMA